MEPRGPARSSRESICPQSFLAVRNHLSTSSQAARWVPAVAPVHPRAVWPQWRPDRQAADSAPGEQTIQWQPAQEKWMHRPWARRECSSARRSDAPPCRRTLRRQTSRGRYARSSLAIYAVGDATQHVFHFAHTGIGVELIQRPAAAESAIGRLEPRRRLVAVAEGFRCIRVDLGQAYGAIGLGGREAGMLREAARQGALGDANLLGDFGLADVEPLGQKEELLYRQTFADQLRKSAAFVYRPAENEFTAEHIGYGVGCHNQSPAQLYAIWLNRIRHNDQLGPFLAGGCFLGRHFCCVYITLCRAR
jgi:hypothetical protein